MSFATFFSDACTDTAFTALPTHNAAWAQDPGQGTWRISSNGTSAGCTVTSSARCYLAVAPGPLQAMQFAILGSSLAHEEGILSRFTEDNFNGFWGGIGYVSFLEAGDQLLTHRLDGGGSHTQIASGTYAPVSGDIFRNEWPTLTSLRVMVDGVENYNVTDATYATGSVGLFGGVSIDDSALMSIDDILVEQDLGIVPSFRVGPRRRGRHPAVSSPGGYF